MHFFLWIFGSAGVNLPGRQVDRHILQWLDVGVCYIIYIYICKCESMIEISGAWNFNQCQWSSLTIVYTNNPLFCVSVSVKKIIHFWKLLQSSCPRISSYTDVQIVLSICPTVCSQITKIRVLRFEVWIDLFCLTKKVKSYWFIYRTPDVNRACLKCPTPHPHHLLESQFFTKSLLKIANFVEAHKKIPLKQPSIGILLFFDILSTLSLRNFAFNSF